jgi:iron(II)-dependent oxidoreductase
MKLSILVVAFLFARPQAAVPPNMAEIPAGEFWMGRVQMFRQDEFGYFLRPRIDDLPAHVVHIDRFYIDKYEVTHDDYARFVKATGHRVPFHWKNGLVPEGFQKYPVYNVSWDDATAYCKWAGKRLPTEAEWEKAARGGAEKKRYPWGDELRPAAAAPRGAAEGGASKTPAAPAPPPPKLAHYGALTGPTAVGSYPPNGYGMYDVIGNVAEWVNDWYDRTYYAVSPESNPKGPDAGMYRVFRGNSWSDLVEMSDQTETRVYGVYFRNFLNPFHRTNVVGFRCAL